MIWARIGTPRNAFISRRAENDRSRTVDAGGHGALQRFRGRLESHSCCPDAGHHVVLDEAYQHGIEREDLVRRCLFACQVQQGENSV